MFNYYRKHIKHDSLFLTKYEYFESKKEPKWLMESLIPWSIGALMCNWWKNGTALRVIYTVAGEWGKPTYRPHGLIPDC